MRHQRAGKKLGRDSAHRKALYSNLAGALIEHGRIRTTEAKAKAVRPVAEKMITLIRVVNASYFVAFSLTPDANLGKARYMLRTRVPALLKELS